MVTITLLSLPLEVRNQVYQNVIFSSSLRPSGPEACRSSHYGITDPCGTSMGYRCVGYVPARVIGLPLLLVNKQVNSEVRNLLDSTVRRNQVIYKLDCIIENVGRLFVTPLSLPVVASKISVFEIDLRFFGDYNLKRGCVALWGDSLLALLAMILRRGPNFLCVRDGKSPRNLEVEVMALNFLRVPKAPEWMSSTQLLLCPGENSCKERELDLRAVEREIDNVLDCRRGLWRENHILYERIRFVKSMADGKLRRQWDLRAIANQQPENSE